MRLNIKRRQGVTSHCPISKSPGPFNSAHRALQVEGCAAKILKKGRTLIDNSTRADDDRLLRGIAYNYMG